jgi:hypothetical protein
MPAGDSALLSILSLQLLFAATGFDRGYMN